MSQKRQNHFYDGWLYHLLADPPLRRVRQLVRTQVKPGSTLIDIGCGTGELIFSLADLCSELVGVEASKRMWSYGSRRARNEGISRVRFIYGDGARLGNFPTGSFDYATACMVLHEMDVSQRLPLLLEMRRLARTLVLVDYRVPPPTNLEAKVCRLIERLAGRNHYRNFISFVSGGGLPVLVEKLGLSMQRETFFQRQCFHLITSA
jgi:SAM-dependent methyltransferase